MCYNGTMYYYILNLQGDVVRMVNASGTTVATYKYDAWGAILSATGTMAEINPLRYRGYYYDSETGFYYLQSRYYDPAIGRFINADSYASTGQGFLGYNMFAYCGNNPINYTDVAGSFPWPILVGAAIGGFTSALVAGVTGGTIKEIILEGLWGGWRWCVVCCAAGIGIGNSCS